MQQASSLPAKLHAGLIARMASNSCVEHWVVAQRQGQVAALNMLDRAQNTPMSRSSGANTMTCGINYIGHAQAWDELVIDGDIMAKDCMLRFKKQGRVLAELDFPGFGKSPS